MTNPIASFMDYIRSSKAELEKVTWPTRQETLRYSLLVVGVSLVTAAFFAALDFGLGQGVDLVLKGRPSAAPTQPIVPDLEPINSGGPTIEGIDAEGNVVPLNVTPLPMEGGDDAGFTVTPE
ncbi:preprotein translocase subunit SecE [Candidatus Uhrbacteria bacterium]|nr:MAG: preprotein translocase subunit SecE [Candidatus Uhrbacteria bacterium]